MQNEVSKLLLLVIFSVITIFINSFIGCLLLTIITIFIVMFSNLGLDLINYLLKIKYLFLLFILGIFNINIVLVLYKLLIIYILCVCYVKTTPLITRYNTLYGLLKIFNLEKYTVNVLMFIPIFSKELKNIKVLPLNSILLNTKNKIKLLKTRFIGYEYKKFKLYSNDYAIITVLILFFILTIYAEVII